MQCLQSFQPFLATPTNSKNITRSARILQCRCAAPKAQPAHSSKQSQPQSSALLQQASAGIAHALDSNVPKLGFSVAMGLGVALLLLDAPTAHAAQLHSSSDASLQQQIQFAGNVSCAVQPLMDLAENEGFWQNVLRYVQYFFTVLLGTAYVALKPFVELFKRPVTAVLGIGLAVGLAVFVSWTVSAMLGMNNDVVYEFSPYVN